MYMTPRSKSRIAIGSYGCHQGDLGMLTQTVTLASEPIDAIKLIMGRIVEERRKRLRMTQSRLASKVGISVRWLREIESGNPRSVLENHIRCWLALGMPASHIFVPVMFMENNMRIPLEFLFDDPSSLRESCIRSIGEYCVGSLVKNFGNAEMKISACAFKD